MAHEAIRAARAIFDVPGTHRRELLAGLFEAEKSASAGDVRNVLGGEDAGRLLEVGLAREADGSFVPLSRVDRVGALLVASDLRGHRWHHRFVMGPGPSGYLLAGAVRTRGGGRALDLGCGSGVQALLLAAAGLSVLAVDINPRALAFTRFNAALNALDAIEPRAGDFLAEAPDESLDAGFDVVVANPPFVLAPGHELIYRDRPLPGDAVTRRTLERAVRALAPGGRAWILGNWIDRGDHWSEPVREWIHALSADAVVTRVAEDSPGVYAARWTKDLPTSERATATADWTAALEAEGVRLIHVGVIGVSRPSPSDALGRQRFEIIDRVEAPRGATAAA